MASSSFKKLRRLAPRAMRVVERRKATHPAIAVYETTLVPRAEAFIAAYDAVLRYEPAWRKETAEGRSAVAELVKEMRTWIPVATKAITSFDPSAFLDASSVADDVINDTEQFIRLVETHRNDQGQPLEFAAQLSATLSRLQTAAAKEVSESEASNNQYQQLVTANRLAAGVFDAELQALRLTLLAAFGRNDNDFQRLRADRSADSNDDNDDDEEEKDPTPPPSPPTPPDRPKS